MAEFIQLLCAVLLVISTEAQRCRKYADQLLLISMDGFRWDYTEKVDTPNFDRIRREGATTPQVTAVFTTKTFPSHYSIVTGLYAESHGITSNNMYDPVFDQYFGMSTTTSKWWNAGVPIWISAKTQGLATGTVFWPGSEVEIRGLRPDFWLPYHDSYPFESRIDMCTEWLKKRKYNFVTLYFHEPDRTGHRYGPDSSQIKEKIKEMDELLGYLFQKFDDYNLWESVNVILTSDHGMTSVDSKNRLVDVSPYMSMVERVIDYGPIMQFTPKSGQEDALVNSLNNLNHLTAYKKADIPNIWHYSNNRRIMSVLAVADEGWSITENVTLAQRSSSVANHGYDNRLDSMKTIFYAKGPNIAANVTLCPFSSVDLYPLMCELLGVSPLPNNGSLANTVDILRPYKDTQTCGVSAPNIHIACIVFVLLLSFLCNE